MKNVDTKLIETQKKFKIFYNEKLREKYKYLAKIQLFCWLFLVLSISFSVYIVHRIMQLFDQGILRAEVWNNPLFSVLALILFLLCGGLIYWPFYYYDTKTKDSVMKNLLSFWGAFGYNNEDDIIGKQVLRKSEIFPYFDSVWPDEAFYGNYHNTEIKISEHQLLLGGRQKKKSVFS